MCAHVRGLSVASVALCVPENAAGLGGSCHGLVIGLIGGATGAGGLGDLLLSRFLSLNDIRLWDATNDLQLT